MKTENELIQSPKQKRSEQTLRKIVHAAAKILERKSLAATSLTEIVQAAGLTVGAFYARFRNKEALILHMEQMLYEGFESSMGSVIDSDDRNELTLREMIQAEFAQAAQLYRQNRGPIRAIIEHAKTDPKLQRRLNKFNAKVLNGAVEAMMKYQDEIHHPDPRRAIEIGLMQGINSLREVILFKTIWPAITDVSLDELIEEISYAFYAYLAHRPEI